MSPSTKPKQLNLLPQPALGSGSGLRGGRTSRLRAQHWTGAVGRLLLGEDWAWNDDDERAQAERAQGFANAAHIKTADDSKLSR